VADIEAAVTSETNAGGFARSTDPRFVVTWDTGAIAGIYPLVVALSHLLRP
jgi:hypothetical protein